jgi:hypothetical protein
MSSEIHATGRFTYEDDTARQEAQSRAEEILSDEEETVREVVTDEWDTFFSTDGLTITVDMALSGPSDWLFTVEALVEAFAEDAVSGYVDVVVEGADGKTRYHAGGDEEEIE